MKIEEAEARRIVGEEIHNMDLDKGDRVLVFDKAGYGVRPSGERVGTGEFWVEGTVEFTITNYGWQYRYVSVYCDDGRGRRVVPPHEVVLVKTAIEAARNHLAELEDKLSRAEHLDERGELAVSIDKDRHYIRDLELRAEAKKVADAS